jgi:hypothetical protein
MKIDFKVQFNIKNSNVILGNIQAEDVQIGDYASIHKQPTTENNKKVIAKIGWLLKKTMGWILKETWRLVVIIIGGLLVAILVKRFVGH